MSADDSSTSLVCSANLMYSKQEPLHVVESRIRDLHCQLKDQAYGHTDSGAYKVLTVVHPFLEEDAPSLTGSSVSTIGSVDSQKHISALPRTRSMIQLMRTLPEDDVKRRKSSGASPADHKGWGYFVDAKQGGNDPPKTTYRRFMTYLFG